MGWLLENPPFEPSKFLGSAPRKSSNSYAPSDNSADDELGRSEGVFKERGLAELNMNAWEADSWRLRDGY